MIARIWIYFGVVGSLSVLAWFVAWALFAGYARSRRRTQRYWVALGLAIMAAVLARFNSAFVSDIEVDRSAEQTASMNRQKEMRRQLITEAHAKAAKVRYAGDTTAEVLDLDGLSAAKKSNVLDNVAAPVDDEAKYAYRLRGKQSRAGAAAAATITVSPVGIAPVVEVKPRLARVLPEIDVIRANRYDRMNLFVTRWTFLLAWLLVAWDYLARFNRTLDHLYPLPVAGNHVDMFWPKNHTVWWPSPASAALATYLANVVRKGETFLYFGPVDPLGVATLPRLVWRKWQLWPVRIVRSAGYDDEFVFESAWFHRYAFVIAGKPEVERRLAGLKEFLQQRQRTHARARKSVHVVWNCHDTPPPDFGAVATFCRETNFKLIVIGPAAADMEFEETIVPPRG